MTIAEATNADRDDVLHVERAAFPDEDVAALVAALLDDPSARPLLSLLAREEGKPVGHILFSAARLSKARRATSRSRSSRRWPSCPRSRAGASAAA